jgi:hypothetical protein
MKNQERQDKERGGSHQEGASNVLPKYFAKTLAGMERLLKDELIELGASDLSVLRRGIEFGADMPTLFRICLCSRFAIRVLRPVLWFEADNTDALYEEAKKMGMGLCYGSIGHICRGCHGTFRILHTLAICHVTTQRRHCRSL